MSLFRLFKKKSAQHGKGRPKSSSLPTEEWIASKLADPRRDEYLSLGMELLKYKRLDPVKIDLEYPLHTSVMDVSVSIAAETEKYIFYSFRSQGIQQVLRQSKENRDDIRYFGLIDSYKHVLFHGYMFYTHSVGRDNVDIGCVDPETGKNIRCEVLSKKTYLNACFVTCQDDVCEIKVKNDQLEVKVKRTRTDCVDDDPFDLDTTYYIYISCEDGRFSVERVFFDINLDKVKVSKRGKHHRWYIVEGDGKYFFLSNERKIAKSSKGYVLQTGFWPLAEKILDELDSFGEEKCPAVSFLGLHKVMRDTFSTLTRNAAQKFIEDEFLNKEDWLFSIPETDHMWTKVIGTQETRKAEISNWLSKALHMQINSAYCLCQRYNSLNLAFVVAMITEYVSEESCANDFKHFALYLSKKSKVKIDPTDLQVFAFYYRLLCNDAGQIFKDLGVGEDIDFEQILTGNASKEPAAITKKETNHSIPANTKEVLQPITITEMHHLHNHFGKFVKLEIDGLDNFDTFMLRYHQQLPFYREASEEQSASILAKPLTELTYSTERGDIWVKIEPISVIPARSYEECHYIYGILRRSPPLEKADYILTNAFIALSDSHLEIVEKAIKHQSAFEYRTLEDGTISVYNFVSDFDENLVIPETIDGKIVSAISQSAFSGNQTLKTLTIPNTVKRFDYGAFCGCDNLESVFLGDGVETMNVAFDVCQGLKKVLIGKSLSEVGRSFHNCHALTAFEIDPDNSQLCTIDGVLFSKNKRVLVYCPCGKKGKYTIPQGTKVISENAFENTDLEEIVIPDTVEEIGYDAIEDYFDGKIVVEHGSYAQQYFSDEFDGECDLVVLNVPQKEDTLTATIIETTQAEKLFCRRCGTQLPLDSDFCFKCGTKVENNIPI